MRGKRSKQYRKLMQQYNLTFGFREPYQVLLDSTLLLDADKFKMDLLGMLEHTLHGKVKPMITQCSIRHLYALNAPETRDQHPGIGYVIDKAKTFERRRCGHLPEEHAQPLEERECISSVVDGKGSGGNRNRYVLAVDDERLRREMRGKRGVPLVYVRRSVMVMEPMSDRSSRVREGEERGKMREGIRRREGVGVEVGDKRKRDGGEGVEDEGRVVKKVKKFGGAKGPNPLSVKKAKPAHDSRDDHLVGAVAKKSTTKESLREILAEKVQSELDPDTITKKKRRRKHKSASEVKGEDERAGGEQGAGDEDAEEP